MSEPFYDVIVCGAGIEGLATAYHSVKAGRKTLLIEQYDFPNRLGSSHGHSRIIRRAHYNAYGTWMDYAFRVWEDLEQQTGVKLYIKCGMVMFGSRKNAEMPKYIKSLGPDVETITAKEMRERFPGFTPSDDYYGVLDKEGGVLLADKAVAAFMSEYMRNGGEFRSNCKLVEIGSTSTGRKIVRTSQGAFRTRAVVLTLGPWCPRFLEEQFGVKVPVEAHETIMPYFRVKPGYDYRSPKFPVLLYRSEGDEMACTHLYMKPGLEDRHSVNAGVHYGERCDPDAKRGKVAKEYLRVTRTEWSKFLPGVDFGRTTAVHNCMYAENLKDTEYIIDEVPGQSNVFFATGFYGTGFKVAPVVGKILFEMATQAAPSYDVRGLKLSRFKSKL